MLIDNPTIQINYHFYCDTYIFIFFQNKFIVCFTQNILEYLYTNIDIYCINFRDLIAFQYFQLSYLLKQFVSYISIDMMDNLVEKTLSTYSFFFRKNPRSGITRLKKIMDIFKASYTYCQILFQKCYISLYSHHQHMRCLLSYTLSITGFQHCLLFLFSLLCSNLNLCLFCFLLKYIALQLYFS